MKLAQIYLAVWGSFFGACAIALLAIVWIPQWDSELWPPLDDVKLVSADFDPDDGWLVVNLSAMRTRNCERGTVGWLVGTPDHYRHVFSSSMRPADLKGETPKGVRFDLYPQRIDVLGAGVRPGEKLLGVATSRCQSMYLNYSDLGPLDIPSPPTGEFTAASGPGR